MRSRLAALVPALALVLSGCMSLPTDGPVTETYSEGSLDDAPGIYIDPKPPEPDAPPADIVDGFLDAMTATPMQLNDARAFLTRDAVAAWSPGTRTITYEDAFQPRGSTNVTVRLLGAQYLEARGAYVGRLPAGERTLTFPMAREDGQWRIAEAPDALVVPETWFEGRFRQVALYFFDPSAQILVPEPVFMPIGETFATALVRALLRGPGRSLEGVSRSFLPPGLRLDDLSVPVSEDGVAELRLSGYSGQLNRQAGELMLAQLAWTLRQDPSIRSFRVTIGDRPVTLPGGVGEYSLEGRLAYDPTGLQASSSLYGLREGRLVSGDPTDLVPVDGPMGVKDQGVRTAAVSLDATTVAGVSADGTRLLLTSVRAGDERVTEIASDASRLLRPAWDFSDRLWLVDGPPSGAAVSYYENGRLHSLQVPGISGERVVRFLVSRDGSRLVAVVRKPSGDRLLVSRIVHDADGRVAGATRAERIAWGEPEARIRDLAWTSPTSVAVLHEVAKQLFELRTVAVDGAPSAVDTLLTQLTGKLRALAGSPVPSEPLYAVTNASLVDPRGDQAPTALDPGTTSVGYVG